jgi:hypothetical protein
MKTLILITTLIFTLTAKAEMPQSGTYSCHGMRTYTGDNITYSTADTMTIVLGQDKNGYPLAEVTAAKKPGVIFGGKSSFDPNKEKVVVALPSLKNQEALSLNGSRTYASRLELSKNFQGYGDQKTKLTARILFYNASPHWERHYVCTLLAIL